MKSIGLYGFIVGSVMVGGIMLTFGNDWGIVPILFGFFATYE